MKQLILVSRDYCHLCREMEDALEPLASEFGCSVEVLDVDTDSDLEARFNELVPVLLHDGKELCHHFLDVAKVRDYLGKIL
ncbi:MAG: glutaredoxin family protein [Propionivibrio sp.]